MALNQYSEEALARTDSSEDMPSLQKCNSSTDAAADSERNATGSFDCNICLECVQDPVVTLCGHLYCWPCIYKWLDLQSVSSKDVEQQKPQCPVCKSEVSQSTLVPLYGRGQAATPSERKAYQRGVAIPRRPLGPRSNIDMAVSESLSQTYHPHRFNSIPSSYTSAMLSTSGPLNRTFGDFGEMIYARVFGNHMTNIYSYSNSSNLSGNNDPRTRRNLMLADKSLSRICVFLLYCLIVCLLLF